MNLNLEFNKLQDILKEEILKILKEDVLKIREILSHQILSFEDLVNLILLSYQEDDQEMIFNYIEQHLNQNHDELMVFKQLSTMFPTETGIMSFSKALEKLVKYDNNSNRPTEPFWLAVKNNPQNYELFFNLMMGYPDSENLNNRSPDSIGFYIFPDDPNSEYIGHDVFEIGSGIENIYDIFQNYINNFENYIEPMETEEV